MRHPISAQVTSMANTMTCYASSNMAGFRQKPITSFLVITWTEENNHWKPFASFWRTRSNILKTSSSCAVTTKVPVSIGYMVFMMNVRSVSLACFPNRLSDYCWLVPQTGKRRYNIKLWKTFTDCFNCLPIAAIIDEKIFTMHGGLSPDLQSMEQIRRVMRPTDVPDAGERNLRWAWIQFFLTLIVFFFPGLLCDLLWSDPDKDITGWSENDRGVSFTFGPDVVSRFLQKHDMDLICRAHQVSFFDQVLPVCSRDGPSFLINLILLLMTRLIFRIFT